MSSDRESTLERLLSGEIDARGPEGAALLKADPTLKEIYERSLALQSSLNGAGEEQRQTLQQLASDPAAARQSTRVLDRVWQGGGSDPPRVPRGLRLVPLAFAAAAAILAIWILLPEQASEPSTSQWLGNVVEIIEPRGTVDDFGTFAWKPVAHQSAVQYELHVFDPTTDREIVSQVLVDQTAWTPTFGQTQSMGATIRWSLRAVDLRTAEVLAHGSAVATQR